MAELTSFERTQLWKEHTHPQIIRQSALKAALEIANINNLQLNVSEIIALTQHFIEYLETGDRSWIKKTDEKLLQIKNKKDATN